jgi:hypothetical protein
MMPKAYAIRWKALDAPDKLRLSVTLRPGATPWRINRIETMESAEKTTTLETRASWAKEHWGLFFSDLPLRIPNLECSRGSLAIIPGTAANSPTFAALYLFAANKLLADTCSQDQSITV